MKLLRRIGRRRSNGNKRTEGSDSPRGSRAPVMDALPTAVPSEYIDLATAPFRAVFPELASPEARGTHRTRPEPRTPERREKDDST